MRLAAVIDLVVQDVAQAFALADRLDPHDPRVGAQRGSGELAVVDLDDDRSDRHEHGESSDQVAGAAELLGCCLLFGSHPEDQLGWSVKDKRRRNQATLRRMKWTL